MNNDIGKPKAKLCSYRIVVKTKDLLRSIEINMYVYTRPYNDIEQGSIDGYNAWD